MTVTFITGANSGIGRAAALKLAAEGHQVFAGMRSHDKGAKLLDLGAGLDITPVVCDVADDASVVAAAAQIHDAVPAVDVLINNAGIGFNAVTEDIDIDDAKGCMEVNLWGVVRCVKAFGAQMRAAGGGHIVNISSIAGTMGLIAQPVYVASKFALEGLSECLAQEMAPDGVKVSVIEPGVTRTAILPKNEGHPEPTEFGDHYQRMFDFYAAGIAANVSADVVGSGSSPAQYSLAFAKGSPFRCPHRPRRRGRNGGSPPLPWCCPQRVGSSGGSCRCQKGPS